MTASGEGFDAVDPDGGVGEDSPTEQVRIFQEIIDQNIEEIFPEKRVRISNKDKVFITSVLKSLDKRKKRKWRKNEESAKYISIKH